MPGIGGRLPIHGATRMQDDLDALIQPLIHESSYSVRRIALDGGGDVFLVDPGLDRRLTGAARSAAGITVAYYGEFYNRQFQGMEDGDRIAALLADLYVEHGADLPAKLDGSFVLFVADARKGVFLLCNDHYAARPVFYAEAGGVFYFSPEAKGVAAARAVDTAPDTNAFVDFLLCGHPLGDRTLYRNIRPLTGGSVLTIGISGVAASRSYTYCPAGSAEDLGDQYYVEALSNLLLSAAGKMSRDLDSCFIPLSGGVDSRLIAGCLDRLYGKSLNTVSWGVAEGPPESDAATGRAVASRLKANHRFIRRAIECFDQDIGEMIYRIDGLNTDPAFHHNELTAIRRVREEFGGRYVLRGEECFGPRPEARSDLEVLSAAGVFMLGDYPDVQRLLNPSLVPGMVGNSTATVDGLLRDCPSVDFTDRRDHFYFDTRIFQYHTRSAYYKRTIADVRNPWLDKDVLDFMQKVPVRYRFNKYLYKKTAHAMFPELMDIPIAKKNSLEDWPETLRNDQSIQHFVRRRLLDSRSGFDEFLNMDEVRALYERVIAPKPTAAPLRRRSLTATKEFLRTRFPGLYRRLKPALIGHFQRPPLPSEQLLLRLLMLKLWFDIFQEGNCNLVSARAQARSSTTAAW